MKTPRYARKERSQIISPVASARDRYSASADDLETVFCFLIFYVIGEFPSLMKQPVRDFLVVGHAPQSESQ